MASIKTLLYILATLTCLACTVLLYREYLERRSRLLLWSALCFVGLTVNNALLSPDLSIARGPGGNAVPPLRLHLGRRFRIDVVRSLIDFLAGAVACTYVIAGAFFLRFWHRTRDRLFLSFSGAFWLLAINQVVVDRLDVSDERSGLVYLLRVVGFLVILFAIVEKNLAGRRSGRRR